MSWSVPRHFAWVEADENSGQEVWVLNAERNMIFGISTVALAIWRAAEGLGAVSAVVDRLVAEQGWAKEEIAEPVEDFVHILVEQGFLEEVSA